MRQYSTLQRWKERILLDIRLRGLKPGDAYLTVEETGTLLGCSRATAHRAMKKLIEEGILYARAGSGTFIGEEARQTALGVIQTLHVLSPTRATRPGLPTPLVDLVQSVSDKLGGLGIQFNCPPEENILDYLFETVVKPFRAGNIRAVVAISCPWKVHQYLKDQGLPAVVFGSMFQDRQYLPSIDKDSIKGAELLVDYLIEKGHKRIGVIMPASGVAGVDFFIDSVGRRLSLRGMPADSLSIRYCTGDKLVTVDRVRELLQGSNHPTAVIADEEHFANLIRQAAESIGLRVPEEVEIVFEGSIFRAESSSRYPHTQITASMEELSEQIVEMIGSLSRSEPFTGTRFLPTQLVAASKNSQVHSTSARPRN